MERRPFVIKERPFSQRVVRAIPFIIAWMVGGPLIVTVVGPHVTVGIVLLLVFGYFFTLIFLHVRWSTRLDLPALVASPCPKCGVGPMKFDRGSQGDNVFTCEMCQIEWTLSGSPLEGASSKLS